MKDMALQMGKLEFVDVSLHPELVADPTALAAQALEPGEVLVAQIDADLADTAAFCEAYGIALDISANCVVLEAKYTDIKQLVACLILATDKIDVNGIVRKHLGARKISFAPMDVATSLTAMQYGGITPIGLPGDWIIIVDESVAGLDHAVVGSGIRGSKLLVKGTIFTKLPSSTVMNIKKGL